MRRPDVFASASSGLAFWESTRASDVASIVRRYAPTHSRTAIDLGCGTGAVAHELAGTFESVIGVDTSEEGLLSARRRTTRTRSPRYLRGDAARLPVRSSAVDVVYSYGAFHHLPVEIALAEVRRILRPGGVAVIADFLSDGKRLLRSRRRHVWEALTAFQGYRRRLGVSSAVRITAFRLRPAWIRHVRSDTFLTISDFSRIYAGELPGLKVIDEGSRAIAVWISPQSERGAS